MRSISVIPLLVFVLAALLAPLSTRAQTSAPPPTTVAVLHTAAEDQSDHLALRTFFTLRDRNGNPVLKKDVQLDSTGSMQLTGTASVPVAATIGDPTTPIRIALVIDASGSMAGRIDQVRAAAKKAVEAAPPQAEIAVFSFANSLKMEGTGFLQRTDQLGAIENEIDTFPAMSTDHGTTCLYDATAGAMNILIGSVQNPIERRAMIVFTDGKDRENVDIPCQTSFSKEQVITNAQEASGGTIPIYMIGLCGASNCENLMRADMDDVAKKTSAVARFGPLQEMEAQFTYIMEVLNSQWVATANVYPHKGTNPFAITVNMNDKTMLNGTSQFESPSDYAGAPGFTIIPQYVPEQDSYTITLNVANPDAVSRVSIDMWEGESSGLRVMPPKTIEHPAANQTFDVPTTDLKPDREYWFRLTAQDRNGLPIKDDKSSAVLYTYKVDFKPELGYSIEDVKPDWEHKQVAIRLQVHGKDSNALVFKGKIEDKETREVVANIPSTPLQDQLLTVPMPAKWQQDDPSTYVITLNLDNNGRELTQIAERAITPPPAPGFFERLGTMLGSPIALGLLGVALVGVIGGFLYVRRRPQQVIPLPFNSPTMMFDQATVLPTAARGQVRLRIVKTPDRTQLSEQTLDVPCTIGRAKSDLIILGDDGLSRPHVQITVQNGTVLITDLKSTNGTFINDTRLKANTPTRLEPRTQVRLGPNTSLTCEVLSFGSNG